jgi:hypothetical protein
LLLTTSHLQARETHHTGVVLWREADGHAGARSHGKGSSAAVNESACPPVPPTHRTCRAQTAQTRRQRRCLRGAGPAARQQPLLPAHCTRCGGR